MIKGTSCHLIKPIELTKGEYEGIWSGYIVRIYNLTNFPDYVEIRTDKGIRGINVPCKVIVGDEIEIQTLRLEKENG